ITPSLAVKSSSLSISSISSILQYGISNKRIPLSLQYSRFIKSLLWISNMLFLPPQQFAGMKCCSPSYSIRQTNLPFLNIAKSNGRGSLSLHSFILYWAVYSTPILFRYLDIRFSPLLSLHLGHPLPLNKSPGLANHSFPHFL